MRGSGMAPQDTCHLNEALEGDLAPKRQTSECSMQKGRMSKLAERDKALSGLESASDPVSETLSIME